MTSPFFPAAIELMRRDADFADKMWQLYTLDARLLSLGVGEAAHLSQLSNELGRRLSQEFGLDMEEAAEWLAYNVASVVQYYGAHYPYGSSLHKRSAVALLFHIIKSRRAPSKSEYNTVLIVLLNLFYIVVYPLLFLAGVLHYQPIFPWVDRALFMLVGIGLVGIGYIVIAKIARTSVKDPRELLAASESERRFGFPFLHRVLGPITPLRVSLSCEMFKGIGIGMVFYAAGTFWNETYTVLELIIAVTTGIVVLYEIFGYIFKKL